MGRLLTIVLLCAIVSCASILHSAEARNDASSKPAKPTKPVCSATSCPANSVCKVTGNTIKCSCAAGFGERRGQCLSAACISANCPANSTCATGKNKKVACQCNAGFKSVRGQCVTLNPCASTTCPTNAACFNEAVGDDIKARCRCGANFVLQNGVCVPLDPCAKKVCQPNAACTVTGGKAVCSCKSGFIAKGDVCAVLSCAGVRCQANAACSVASGKAVCSCKPGFKASRGRCIAADPCASATCPVDSTCSAVNNMAVCTCNDATFTIVEGVCTPLDNGGDDVSTLYLAGHNDARAAVGVAPLEWDDAIAAQATSWAASLASSGCELTNGDNADLGQNLAMADGAMTPEDAVAEWVAAAALYTPAAYPGGCSEADGACDYYTQVIWGATTKVGCGSSSCASGATIHVCDYSPAGNVDGELPF
eukprot:jgi/Mesen1/10378/ME000081S09769